MLTLRDYIEVNRLEGLGCSRLQARFYVSWGSTWSANTS